MKKLIYTISFFLFVTHCFSQKKKNFNIEKKSDSIISYYLKKEKLDSVGYIAHKTSIHLYKVGDYKNAVHYALKEVNLGIKILKEKKYKNAIHNLALFYYKNNEYYKSINNYQKVIDSFDIDKKTFSSYCGLANNYSKLGDHYQAITYFENGLSKPDSLSRNNLLNQTINFALAYDKVETYTSQKEEFKKLKKADSIFNSNSNFTDLQFYSLQNTLGLFYKNDLSFNFEKSKFHFNRSIKRASINSDTIILIKTYNNLGELLNKTKNDSAFFYINKGLKISNPADETKALLHSNLATYYFNKSNLINALKELQKSLKIITQANNKNDYKSTPTIKELSYSKNKHLALDNLKDKANYFLKLKNDKYKNAQIALEHITLADKLLDIIKAESFEINSKLFWQKNASELYMIAVNACYILNKPEKAFYFTEKNKAILLLENIKKNSSKPQNKIPQQVIDQDFSYRKNINSLENELNNNINQQDRIKEKYFKLKIDYKNFINSLKTNYPEYYHFKKNIKVNALKSIQNNLDDNTTVLEYILNGEEGFLLVISKNKAKLFKLNNITNLNPQINHYLKLISKPLVTKKETEQYKNLSNLLYNSLLPFKKNKLIQTKKLLIIPDYTLQNLPFESLKINNQNLIEKFEISYAYSLTFLNSIKKQKRDAKNTFIGFAIKNYNYDNLKDLPNNIAEIDKISNKLNGEKLLNIQATKTNFFSKIKDYKIIHLSTHANANDSISPWIAFKNKKLYLNELYTAKNQAELVVINACNSSLGKINSGEGVFSLARGFFYSGAKSVISSLWNVNDKSNSEITINFYKYLKKGKTKSAALRQAKLDYLSTHSLSEASPYYWSSLILIGDDSTIELNNNNKYLIYSIIILTILFLVIFFIKKSKMLGNKF